MTADKETGSSVFDKLLATARDPEIIFCLKAIRQHADYDIPEKRAGCFQRFHSFVTNPQPKYITAWRADAALEKRWYKRHIDGVLGDVRNALAAAHYHKAMLTEIQTRIFAALGSSNFAERLENVVVGYARTRKMDFEYQAFIFAFRRCLDYLAGALTCYFKREAYNFRELPKSIAKTKVPKVAEAISKAHSRHLSALEFVLIEGRKSVRNRIAHYEFVSAGCVNLTPNGFLLIGGGEELSPHGGTARATLEDALSNRLNHLHACVDDMIDSFISAARESD